MIPTQTIRLIINKKGKSVRLLQNQIGRLISERECWYISNEEISRHVYCWIDEVKEKIMSENIEMTFLFESIFEFF